jgi:hypothetical protein
MNILVNHQISDPEAYWGALGANPAIPEGFKVMMLMAGSDPATAACLWSAPDVDSLKSLVDGTLGQSSSNSYMVIDNTKSFGI